MSDFIFSINTVLPIFLIMGAGYLLVHLRIFTTSFIEKANSACFEVFFPVLIFYNIYASDFKTAFNLHNILYGVIGTTLIFLVLYIAVPLFVKDNSRRGVMIQAMFRSNYLLLGIPMCERMAGVQGLQMASVMGAFIIPVYNTLATFVLARYSSADKPKPRDVAKKVLLNPLIIASALGIVLVTLGVRLPQPVDTALYDVGKIATPLALLVLGGGFQLKSVPKNIKYITIAALGKLAVFPAVLLTIAALMGIKGAPFAVLICVFSTPIAVSSYVMAVRENGDGVLAGQLVVITSIASMFTMFGVIYVSRLFGLV